MANYADYIDPALAVLIPVLMAIGMGCKASKSVQDEHIPRILAGCGVALALLWALTTGPTPGTVQDVARVVFYSIVQGVLCAACAVYTHQLHKQRQKGAQNGQSDPH